MWWGRSWRSLLVVLRRRRRLLLLRLLITLQRNMVLLGRVRRLHRVALPQPFLGLVDLEHPRHSAGGVV